MNRFGFLFFGILVFLTACPGDPPENLPPSSPDKDNSSDGADSGSNIQLPPIRDAGNTSSDPNDAGTNQAPGFDAGTVGVAPMDGGDVSPGLDSGANGSANADTPFVMPATGWFESMVEDPLTIFPVDLDSDGDMDFVTGFEGHKRLVWFENAGGEIFHPKTIVEDEFLHIRDVIGVDLNQDGYQDLIAIWVGDAQDGFISKVVWHKNDGQMNFTNTTLDTDENGHWTLMSVDLDGDDDLDILCVTYDRDFSSVIWLSNQGTEGFEKHLIAGQGRYSRTTHAGDMDGDGDLDVLVPNRNQGTMSWYEQKDVDEQAGGDIEFTQHLLGDGIAAMSMRSIDINKDGHLDILVTTESGNTLAWWENNGSDISPTFEEHIISSNLGKAYFTQAFDVDEDDDIDLLVADADSGNILIYDNNGSHEFTQRILAEGMGTFSQMRLGDIDGDLDTDIVMSANSKDRLAWFENMGAGNFQMHVVAFSIRQVTQLEFVDLDRDGLQDMLFGTTLGEIGWLQKSSENDYQPNWIAGLSGEISSLEVVDIDGDQDIDFLTSTIYDGAFPFKKLYLFKNVEDETFAEILLDNDVKLTTMQMSDLDGDNDLDIVGVRQTDQSIVWYENLGALSFELKSPILPEGRPFKIRVVDLNQDGNQDFIYSSMNDNRFAWLKNDGQENFSEEAILLAEDAAFDIHSLDWDQDGDLDLVTTTRNENKLAWHENNGQEIFTEHILNTHYHRPGDLLIKDLDRDGDVDLLCHAHLSTGWGNPAVVLFENLDGAFAAEGVVLTQNQTVTTINLSDLDADGDLDYVVTTHEPDVILWHDNELYTCSEGFTGPACDQCTYPHATGDGCDICEEGWGGAYCNICLYEGEEGICVEE